MAERKGTVAHPGEILQRTFMDPHGLGVNQLARFLKVPPGRISTILNAQRSISADTAVRLARFFDTTPLYWMNLQARFDLAKAQDALSREPGPPIPVLKDLDRVS